MSEGSRKEMSSNVLITISLVINTMQYDAGYTQRQINFKYEAQTALFKDPVRTAL